MLSAVHDRLLTGDWRLRTVVMRFPTGGNSVPIGRKSPRPAAVDTAAVDPVQGRSRR